MKRLLCTLFITLIAVASAPATAQRGADKAPRFSLADPVQTANAAQAGIDHLQTFGERG